MDAGAAKYPRLVYQSQSALYIGDRDTSLGTCNAGTLHAPCKSAVRNAEDKGQDKLKWVGWIDGVGPLASVAETLSRRQKESIANPAL